MNESKKFISSVLVSTLVTIGCATKSPTTNHADTKPNQVAPEPQKYIPTKTEIDAETIIDIPFAIYCMCQRQSKEVDNDTCDLYNEAMKYQTVGIVDAYIENCKINRR